MRYYWIITVAVVLLLGCNKDEEEMPKDDSAPTVLTNSPSNGASGVELDQAVVIEFSEKIYLADNYTILVNDVAQTCHITDKKLYIDIVLDFDFQYHVIIDGHSVKDAAGNYAGATSFSFSTKGRGEFQSFYEAEDAVLSGGITKKTSMSGYSGTAYVGNFENSADKLTFNLTDAENGLYDLKIRYSTSNWGTKYCNISVNGASGSLELSASNSEFATAIYSKVLLQTGSNEIIISPNYTYFTIDYIEVTPNTDPPLDFSIDELLVTPNPSPEAVNVYNFLKENFGSKIISGAMANHSTNIDEAQWIHDQTGKWPALVGFDFIDHTIPNQSWVQYSAPLDLSKNYWENNGLITLMWHWRDPLAADGVFGEFYTNQTSFDISKITDTNSAEYKAVIEEIDVIATYLQQFEDAGIPVLWRPLHEAAGGWFWWGAKGASPCKALWRILFDRLVNHHGLSNLIWVWTTENGDDALEWYPGDEYVDIVGRDIYPGENQHGSQFGQFKQIYNDFNGKKLIALTECGSVPDPANMSLFGDTWSWFMTWNSQFTRDENHNGVTWWNKFFSYDYVISRDMMPDLK